MLRLIENVKNERKDYAQCVLHSSELMPDGSHRFKTQKSIEKLYEDLEILFDYSCSLFAGATLADYYNGYTNSANE